MIRLVSGTYVFLSHLSDQQALSLYLLVGDASNRRSLNSSGCAFYKIGAHHKEPKLNLVLLVCYRVYRLEKQSVMLVFSTFSLVHLPPPPTDRVWLGGGRGVFCCVGDHILQEFINTLYLNRFRPYKIALPPQTKTQEGSGPQTENHLPQSQITTFGFAFYQSNLSTVQPLLSPYPLMEEKEQGKCQSVDQDEGQFSLI